MQLDVYDELNVYEAPLGLDYSYMFWTFPSAFQAWFEALEVKFWGIGKHFTFVNCCLHQACELHCLGVTHVCIECVLEWKNVLETIENI